MDPWGGVPGFHCGGGCLGTPGDSKKIIMKKFVWEIMIEACE